MCVVVYRLVSAAVHCKISAICHNSDMHECMLCLHPYNAIGALYALAGALISYSTLLLQRLASILIIPFIVDGDNENGGSISSIFSLLHFSTTVASPCTQSALPGASPGASPGLSSAPFFDLEFPIISFYFELKDLGKIKNAFSTLIPVHPAYHFKLPVM